MGILLLYLGSNACLARHLAQHTVELKKCSVLRSLNCWNDLSLLIVEEIFNVLTENQRHFQSENSMVNGKESQENQENRLAKCQSNWAIQSMTLYLAVSKTLSSRMQWWMEDAWNYTRRHNADICNRMGKIME